MVYAFHYAQRCHNSFIMPPRSVEYDHISSMEIAEIRARNVDLPNRITMWLMLDEFSRGFCSQDGIRQEIGMVFWVYRDQKNSLRFAYEWKGKFWICTVKARGHVPNENLLSSITVSLFAMMFESEILKKFD